MNSKIQMILLILISGNIFANQLYPFPSNGKWGYINAEGRIVVAPQYEAADFFSDGLAKVLTINERNEYLYGFINVSGRAVITPKFASISSFHGGMARAQIRGKYAYVLPNGQLANSTLYDYINPATNGASIFKQGELYGFMDVSGQQIVEAQYDKAYDFQNGYAVVGKKNGRNYKYGYIDKTGREIIPLKYDGALKFSEGVAVVLQGKKWIFLDRTGKQIVAEEFDGAGIFQEGLARVQIGGKWGYINGLGELVIPYIYTVADEFSKGLAIVGNGRMYGYINKQNQEITPFIFSRATRFDGKLARVAQGKNNGFMNAQGRYNLSDKITAIGSFHSDRARMRVGRFYGFYSSDAKLAIKPVYLYTSDFKDDLAITVSAIAGGYKTAYINQNGREVYSWNILSRPIPQHDETLSVIAYPNLPFYRESDPTSRLIIKANYGHTAEKKYQRTATPLQGHGLNGILYSVTYFGREGYMFSEGLSTFPAPQLSMGIFAYFKERFGIVSTTSALNLYDRSLNATFFNGSTLSREIKKDIVKDLYFVPFMDVSEAFFIFGAALGYPATDFPEGSTELPNYLKKPTTARFSGKRDSKNTPKEFIITANREKIAVIDKGFGIELIHEYAKPKIQNVQLSIDEKVFFSTAKEEDLEEIITNDMLETNEMPVIIIDPSTNTINVTEIVLEQASNISSDQ